MRSWPGVRAAPGSRVRRGQGQNPTEGGGRAGDEPVLNQVGWGRVEGGQSLARGVATTAWAWITLHSMASAETLGRGCSG